MDNNNFDDSTVLDQSVETKNPTTTDGGEKETKAPKKGEWKKVAMGAGAGIVLGAGATILTSGTMVNGDADEVQLSDEEQTEGYTPLFDENISMASGVNDDMSFAEAFDAAREEVGPGGVFVWHGNVYSTYTPDEWDNMSPEEQDDFAGHFSWSADQPDDVAVEELPGDVAYDVSMATGVSDDMSFSQAFAEAREEVGPGGVFEWHGELYNTYTAEEWNSMSAQEHSEFASQVSGVASHVNASEQYASNDVNYEPEIEVLGVEHDYETGGNIGVIAIDGQEVILADVNGDGTFNLAATDLNGDGQIQDNEIENISDMGLTVDDLGGVDAQVSQAAYQNAAEPEIEVLGVDHDYETGMNFGAIAIDDQEVLLADVTGDGTFNLAAVDLNGDGLIQDNEVQDISGMGLTVNDLGGVDDPVYYTANMDSGYDPDFTNDADVSGFAMA